MTEKTKDSKSLLSSNNVVIVLVVLLAGASFLIGSMWTKLRLLENGGSNTKVANSDNANPAEVPAETAKDVDPVSDADHVRGDRNAKIALIEYSDFECPFCKRFHSAAQQAIEEYDGKLMWVYRHFPLAELHSQAPKQAEAVECAFKIGGDKAFWALTDKIYEVTPGNNGLDMTTLPALAAGVGVNQAQFKTCLDSGEMKEIVDANYQSGLKAGVTGTPGNILLNTETGETTLIPGAVPYESLKSYIDKMLDAS